MVCTLEPWQDLVFTDSTFGPDTACFQNNMSFQSTVIGCETRIITKDMAAKLNAFVTSCYRIMLNIKCLHKVSNHRVYDLNGISQLSCCGMATFCAWRRMDQLTFYFVRAHELAMFLLEWILGYTGKPSLTDLTVATMLHHEVKTG